MIRLASTMGIPPVIAWALVRRAADYYSAPSDLVASDILTEMITGTYDNNEEHIYWEGDESVLTLQDYAIMVVGTFSPSHANELRAALRRHAT